MVSGFTREKLGLHIVSPYRDRTRFCYVVGFKNYPDSPSTRYRIRGGFIFPLWRADSKISVFAAGFSARVWTEDVSGMKKVRIQKHPDDVRRRTIEVSLT